MGEREEWLETERLGLGRRTAIFLGLFGSHGKNDSVDVQYELGGRTMVATGSRSWRPRSEPKRRLARSPQR